MKHSIKYLIGYYTTFISVAYFTSSFISFSPNPLEWGEISRLLFLVILSVAIKTKHG
jgi:hypothetical protein